MTAPSGDGGGPPPRPPLGPPAGLTFSRDLLAGDTLDAARVLLGARLVRDPEPGDAADVAARRVARIVEVEAYLGEDDRASHARMGPTARNRVMFGPPGFAYVYLVYGMHHCLNVVTGPEGRAAAVLIRAAEPIAGVAAMRRDRDRIGRARAGVPDWRLAAGPGLVAAALGIDRRHTGLDLCDPASPLRLEPPPRNEPRPRILAGPRVGVAYAGEPWASHPWRFAIGGSPSVSRRITPPAAVAGG
jgi:DNA-3-methyladenine glycosylase